MARPSLSNHVHQLYTADQFRQLLASAVANAAGRPWDEQFISDLAQRYQQHGQEMLISILQRHQLTRIAGA